MSSKAAATGPGAMVLVAIEQAFAEGERILTDELNERYVRPTGRELGWMAIERIVHARKA